MVVTVVAVVAVQWCDGDSSRGGDIFANMLTSVQQC